MNSVLKILYIGISSKPMSRKFYGQFSPPVDKLIYDNFFSTKTDGISIEAGALDGIWDSSTYFFEKNMNWKTINIEPLPNMYTKLVKNRPLSTNLNVALSSYDGTTEIKNYKHPSLGYDWGNASINYTQQHEDQLVRQCGKDKYVTHSTECMTYKTLIEKLNISELDLFVLDVEGNELNVIDGMLGTTVFPNVFVIEHGHLSTQIILDKLQILPVKYKLMFVNNVNSFFSRDDN